MNTLTGKLDTDRIVADRLNNNDLLNFCRADPFLSICNNDNFWRDRLFCKYGRIEKSTEKSWKTFYLQIVYYFKKSGINRAMKLAAIGGHRDIIDFFIKKGATDWNWGIIYAAKGGHRDLVDFFIQKGVTNWKWAISGAAQGGHQDLVEFFKRKRSY